MPRRLIESLLLTAALLAAGSAWALKSDKDQPINVHADHGDFKADPKNNADGVGIYTGHVVITQGSIVLTADKAILHVVNNDLASADVSGNPATFVQQPDQGEPMHGEAQEISYDAAKNEIDFITDARLSQEVAPASSAPVPSAAGTAFYRPVPGMRLMTADRIRYDTNTQHVVAKAGDQEQRVHLTFPPKPQQAPQAPNSGAGRPGKTPPAAMATRSPAAPTHLLPARAAATRPAPPPVTGQPGSP